MYLSSLLYIGIKSVIVGEKEVYFVFFGGTGVGGVKVVWCGGHKLDRADDV